MKILEIIRNDRELQQFRKEWKEKFTDPFPPWNYDCYGNIDDYKQKIKEALESNNSKKICETCISKICERWSKFLK